LRKSLVVGAVGLLSGILYGCGSGNKPDGDDSLTTPSPGGETTTLPETTVTTTLGPFTCQTPLKLDVSVKASSAKGMALDDSTLRGCAGKIPFTWPHTDEPIQTLRMFKAWGADWGDEGRKEAWDTISTYVKKNNAKVLMGTQVSCNRTEDDADWENVKLFLKILGPEHILGMAIGNEMELLAMKENTTKHCAERVWKPSKDYAKGYYFDVFERRVADLNAMDGFEDVKLTSVFGAYIFAPPAVPFLDLADCSFKMCAMVNTFLKNVLDVNDYRRRFVFSLNLYPYFNEGATLDNPGGEEGKCKNALNAAMDFDRMGTVVGDQTALMREKMKLLLGDDADHFEMWIGETGWSFPRADTLNTPMKWCDEWSSQERFHEFYEKYLAWDHSIDGATGPSHSFYFTFRDSVNFGIREAFGLLSTCDDDRCKMGNDFASTTSMITTGESTMTTTSLIVTTTTDGEPTSVNPSTDTTVAPTHPTTQSSSTTTDAVSTEMPDATTTEVPEATTTAMPDATTTQIRDLTI